MLKVLKYPDPQLKEVSKEVKEFGPELHKFLDELAVTMYHEGGIGLAAPQVGRAQRIFVIDISPSEESPREFKRLIEFINPSFADAEGKVVFEEGCLSVPGLTSEVTRKEKITVHFQDRNGNKTSLRAEGLLAIALQHETDHLDGILFIDRLSPIKRRLLKKKAAKAVAL